MIEYTNEITYPFFQDLDLALFFILDINTEKIIEKCVEKCPETANYYTTYCYAITTFQLSKI